ncbi:MAG TPA: type II secretion system secretin GspD [Candidatus Limnocylindrales bacterium]|nr:type II secretion system secretin GspD [Candidatus Limnocylindrales bacterium]
MMAPLPGVFRRRLGLAQPAMSWPRLLARRAKFSQRLLARRACVTLAAALLAVASAALPAGAQDQDLEPPADPNQIVMNFEEVELTAFIKFISKVTGKNFVFGDKITGTVSVVSPTPVTPNQAYQLFQSVLATQGLTTVDEGVVTRIVATKDARTAGATVISEGGEYPGGFGTRLISLRYVGAGDVARVLAPLVSKDGSIVPYEGTNTVIVSDTSSNLARISEMVRAMDIPGHEETIAVIPLTHADAARTAEQIIEILVTGEGRSGGGRRRGGGGGDDKKDTSPSPSPTSGAPQPTGFKITPDERTNSLIVLAPAVEMRRIRALAASLDVPLRPGEERVHVYYAKHADAEALVEVVSGMLLGGRSRSRRDRKQPDDRLQQTQGLQPTQAGSPPAAQTEDISITADPATNAVVVDAAAQDWKIIEGLLLKLDIPRPQVFIEAIIVEASADKAKALGFDFRGGVDIGGGVLGTQTNLGALAQGFVNPLSLGGLALAAASNDTIELPDGSEIPAQIALFQALENTSDIEVLSAPTLLTLDNQEAEIIVGQNIPFVTGRAADISNVENIFTTVERRDVGIKLRVKPQVAEGDVIVLTVQEEVSALVSDQFSDDVVAQVGPTTTVRSANTTVSVQDGRTVVIGGLMSNRVLDGKGKVPLLGDIPGLGRLFQFRRKDGEKVNLIVFLTPHVIRSPRQLAEISEERRLRFRAELKDPMRPLPGDPEFDAVPVIVETIEAAPDADAVIIEERTAPARAPVKLREKETLTIEPVAPPPPPPMPQSKGAPATPQAKSSARPAAVANVPAPPPERQAAAQASPSASASAAAKTAAAASAREAAARKQAETDRTESAYRHNMREKNNRIYPLNRDTRERTAF